MVSLRAARGISRRSLDKFQWAAATLRAGVLSPPLLSLALRPPPRGAHRHGIRNESDIYMYTSPCQDHDNQALENPRRNEYVYVCAYIRMYVYKSIYVYTYMKTRLLFLGKKQLHIYLPTAVRAAVASLRSMYHLSPSIVYTYSSMFMYVRIYVYTYMRVASLRSMYQCLVSTHTYIHTYIHT